jgi:hypothetical protein
MSDPCEPEEVKLISSLFSAHKPLIEKVIAELQELYGQADWIGPECFFDRTRYYEREMGWPLYRRFISFQELIRPERLVEIKLKTNEIENRHLEGGRRGINIDPGYLSLERLILATGKNYTHRVYLSKGIYADLTLIFHKGAFRTLPWTYRDYADPEIMDQFAVLRERYKRQIRGIEEPS